MRRKDETVNPSKIIYLGNRPELKISTPRIKMVIVAQSLDILTMFVSYLCCDISSTVWVWK